MFHEHILFNYHLVLNDLEKNIRDYLELFYALTFTLIPFCFLISRKILKIVHVTNINKYISNLYCIIQSYLKFCPVFKYIKKNLRNLKT